MDSLCAYWQTIDSLPFYQVIAMFCYLVLLDAGLLYFVHLPQRRRRWGLLLFQVVCWHIRFVSVLGYKTVTTVVTVLGYEIVLRIVAASGFETMCMGCRCFKLRDGLWGLLQFWIIGPCRRLLPAFRLQHGVHRLLVFQVLRRCMAISDY